MHIGHVASSAWWDIMNIYFPDSKDPVEMQTWLNGHRVTNAVEKDIDVIICWGVTQMDYAWNYKETHKHIPLINYQWDIYEWAINTPRYGEYNYRKYIKFLVNSKEIWVPSEAEKKRTQMWLMKFEGRDDIPIHVVRCNARFFDRPTTDGGYVFTSLRENPDPRLGMLEQACEELGIPLVSSRHEMEREEYEQAVANCRLAVSHFYEMSTGGLGALEAYYLGKPVLVSDSPMHGGKDYFGERAVYFKDGDYEDFKQKLSDMFHNVEKYRFDVTEAQDYCRRELSSEAMGNRIKERLAYVLR